MKLNNEKVNTLIECRINDDTVAMCEDRDGFMKLMVFYRHGKPIWAHKSCHAVPEILPKSQKKNLTKRKKKV